MVLIPNILSTADPVGRRQAVAYEYVRKKRHFKRQHCMS